MADAKVLLRQATQKHKKIDHPLAKYTNTGQLTCVVCQVPVKSETMWPAHLLGKRHKDAVAETEKNAKQKMLSKRFEDDDDDDVPQNATKRPKHDDDPASVTRTPTTPHVPATATAPVEKKATKSVETMATKIPEGFFDDRKQEKKIRKVAPRDEKEEEWARFEQEIAKESQAAEAIIEDDMEEAMEERARLEVAEQMECEHRVEIWKNKLSSLKAKPAAKAPVQPTHATADEAEEEDDLDDMLGWRSKAL